MREPGVGVGEPGAVAVVAADEDGFRAESCTGLQQRKIGRRVEIGIEPDDFEVEDLDRRIVQTAHQRVERGVVLVQRIGGGAGRRGQQADADGVEPVLLGQVHLPHRRRIEDGEGGQAEWAGHRVAPVVEARRRPVR